MTSLAHILDHGDQAVARLLEQFRTGATMPALVRALAAQAQDVEDALWDVLVLRRLSDAAGAQLDALGRIVGQPREGRSDADYVLWLRARVRINLGSGRGEDLLAAFGLVMQGTTTLQLVEQFPAGLVLRVGSAAAVDPTQAAAILQLAKAAGVQAILEAATTLDTTSFAFDPNGAGFDDGTGTVGGMFVTAF